MNTGTAPRATPDPLSDIYLRMHGQIRRFVASRIPDPEQAEDLVHDVFLQVHDRIGSLRNSEKLDAWIYQITRNRIADHYRRQSRKADPEMPDYLARPEKRDELMKAAGARPSGHDPPASGSGTAMCCCLPNWRTCRTE
jgi:RNA polymerase sigma factor (sigma-70 family)